MMGEGGEWERGEFQRTHYEARDEAEIARSEETRKAVIRLFLWIDIEKTRRSIFRIIVEKKLQKILFDYYLIRY